MTRKELCELCDRARNAIVQCVSIVSTDHTPTPTDRDAVMFWSHVYDVASRELGENCHVVGDSPNIDEAFQTLKDFMLVNGSRWSDAKTKFVKEALHELRTALKGVDQ